MSTSLRADLVLRGGTVLTMDDERRVIDNGVVVIDGERIIAVGTSEGVGDVTARATIDCAGSIVIPGFVDTHTHLFQAPAAGRRTDLPVLEWLRRSMWPYAQSLTGADAADAARFGAMRALRAGTTTVLDHHYAPTDTAAVLAVADAIEQVGLRGVVARSMLGDPVPDFPSPPGLRPYSTAEELVIIEECMAERGAGRRVRVWPGPGSAHAAHPEVLIAAEHLAASHGCRWHTHTSESAVATETFRRRHGASPVEWLESHGLLTHGTHAHAIHVSADDIDALARSSGVAHCPVSNASLASGVAPAHPMRVAGVAVGLGTDGAAVGARGVLECAKLMLLQQRVAAGDPSVITAHDVLTAATRVGADVLGLDTGRIESGRLADIVVVRLDEQCRWPIDDPTVALVTLATERDISDVIANGVRVVAAGCFTHLDEIEVLARAVPIAAKGLQ